MPKKGAGKTSGKKPVSTPNDDDGGYIVFGDDKTDKKRKKGATDQPAQDSQEGKAPVGQDAAKKAETRQLIGGASWTGKYPVTLLSEHCQKQKWAKPEYTMVTPRFTKGPSTDS